MLDLAALYDVKLLHSIPKWVDFVKLSVSTIVTVYPLKEGNPTVKFMAMSSHTCKGGSITCNKLDDLV